MTGSGAISAWCDRWLGAPARTELFRTAHLSTVVGLLLADGRRVVLKIRPRLDRINGCVAVHLALWHAGFPCAQPLAGPVPAGDRVVTAELMTDDGRALDIAPEHPWQSALALARLVSLAPSPSAVPALAPPPPWVGWNHDEGEVWPRPDDRDGDLNASPGPDWLDDAGRRVRARLRAYHAPEVIGHADWEAQNVLWKDARLHVVHDWDSVVSLPESAIAGAAAAVFSVRGERFGFATVQRTAEFLEAYERARDVRWSEDDREASWAAGLWVLSFNAKKATLDPRDGDRVDRLAGQVAERLARSGA